MPSPGGSSESRTPAVPFTQATEGSKGMPSMATQQARSGGVPTGSRPQGSVSSWSRARIEARVSPVSPRLWWARQTRSVATSA